MKSANYENLVDDIGHLLEQARTKTYTAINSILVRTYWEIGKRIVEYEQEGKERAEYGSSILDNLSKDLMKRYGKGFCKSNVYNMRLLYLEYPKFQTLSGKLSWSHYCELLKIDDQKKRAYFQRYAEQDNLSIRDLKRQMYSFHYERLLISRDKKALIEHERQGNTPTKSEDLIKDPYILEFLNLNEDYNEEELEARILNNLQKFLLELGQGFTFVARQKRITIDNDHFYIDLLFYNINLRCYIIIELKTRKFRHEDAGQMNFYINYVKKELNKEGDNEPIGIILCTKKDKVQVEYATAGMLNNLFVSKYKLYLPSKEELEREVRKLL